MKKLRLLQKRLQQQKNRRKEERDMLMPKRVKHRRVHRGRMKGKATKGNTVTKPLRATQSLTVIMVFRPLSADGSLQIRSRRPESP